jgi:hypothetical protein
MIEMSYAEKIVKKFTKDNSKNARKLPTFKAHGKEWIFDDTLDEVAEVKNPGNRMKRYKWDEKYG